VSTTNIQPSSFTPLFTDTLLGINSSWEMRVVDLTAYAGQTVFIAFHYHFAVGLGIAIDTIELNYGISNFRVDFDATPLSGTAPLTVQFNDMSIMQEGVTSWAWDFNNDGEIDSTEQNPSFTFTESGIYSVRLTINDGARYVVRYNFITVDSVSEDDEHVMPLVTKLKENFSNPFNPYTTIRFVVGSMSSSTVKSGHEDMSPSAENVEINVYNVRGQVIRTLVDEVMPAGVDQVVWNGRDDSGNHVGSGIYFARMIAGEHISIRKMMLMK